MKPVNSKVHSLPALPTSSTPATQYHIYFFFLCRHLVFTLRTPCFFSTWVVCLKYKNLKQKSQEADLGNENEEEEGACLEAEVVTIELARVQQTPVSPSFQLLPKVPFFTSEVPAS